MKTNPLMDHRTPGYREVRLRRRADYVTPTYGERAESARDRINMMFQTGPRPWHVSSLSWLTEIALVQRAAARTSGA